MHATRFKYEKPRFGQGHPPAISPMTYLIKVTGVRLDAGGDRRACAFQLCRVVAAFHVQAGSVSRLSSSLIFSTLTSRLLAKEQEKVQPCYR